MNSQHPNAVCDHGRREGCSRTWVRRAMGFLVLGLGLVQAPGVLGQVSSGTALRLEGAGGFISISHQPALNAFPLTITAWVRTQRNAGQVDGIISKYADGSFNGYSLVLNDGRVYAFFSRPGGQVFLAPLGINGGFIADGHWHHLAFVVGVSGGQLYVDGNLRGSMSWSGAMGPATGTQPLQFGRYHNYPNTFQGDIDEVTLWNRALTAGEVNYLKHRRLGGREEGLLANWRLDEGAGLVAGNAVADLFHGTLNGGASWAASHAPIALEPVAGRCLSFNGSIGHVEVAHHAALNAYPFTATAWFRTTNSANVVQGIVNKYMDASGNGWAIMVVNGRLRGFYYRTLANRALDFTAPAFVADGGWHHAAMTVDAAGGRLFLDGVQVGASPWQGAGDAPTSAEPLQIGRYYNYNQHFQGAIDEVAVWNRALSAAEIQAGRNLALTGNEAGLVAHWRLDEGSGSSTADLTGHGHVGVLMSGPLWVGSTAYLGDGLVRLAAASDPPMIQRQYAIRGAQTASAFGVRANATFWRFHDFGTAPASVPVTWWLSAGLRIASTGADVAVQENRYSSSLDLGAYNASTPMASGSASGVVRVQQSMEIEPEPGIQLDSVNELHRLTTILSFRVAGGDERLAGTEATGALRLLHFNGQVRFGNIDAVISQVINAPVAGTLSQPTHVQTTLQLPASGAFLTAGPALRFGGGTAFNVNLGVDGTATNLNGSFNILAAGEFLTAAGVRYDLPRAILNTAGLTAVSLRVWFPTGFGMSFGAERRAMLPYATTVNVVLGSDLLPTSHPLNFTAAGHGTATLYFADESKPVIWSAPGIDWRFRDGEFVLAAVQSLEFVRQSEDRDLSNQALNLVDPLAADRVTNDGYFRNATSAPGVPLRVRADANGASLLTMTMTLRENEFRPHFPYIARNSGGHVPVVGGELTVVDSLVDGASSYLLLAGAAPVPYARDCPPEGGCAGTAKVGAQVLAFTARAGRLGLAEFGFTPDGGLLAWGNIPSAGLTWGYIGGTDYAQRTSEVTEGTLHIPGTFLRGDLTVLPAVQRPAALVLSGWGDATSPTRMERPGTAAYRDGLANYAGLNFRAPAQGRSIIARQDTGDYALTSRSKYYARFGGISGIHEAASFPAGLNLYGYPFTFQSYRLSYLDSANWESRTDGALALGGPAGFNVEFERMKFLCRGNLDSARLPAGVDTKHMVYWNTSIRLRSLQFKPRSGDPCSLTERYLVLGVETALPFIPQPFHAALAFKPNGNLATVATGVEGVDSRFAVPANLSLPGPGGSHYPLTTAGEGYFNNWESAGRPEAGFYSLAGRVRVPFFRDVKVHLHVTPTGPSTSQIHIMGGWPAEEGSGQNRGWTVGGRNYFTQSKFDPNHHGWPVEQLARVGSYRNSADEQFRPRAQQNWIDVAFFDYPLAWNGVLREFTSFIDARVILPVIDVDSRLKQLTPGKVDLDFAQDLNLQLPRIKVLDFANDALNELNAPIHSVSNAIRAQLGAALNTAGLTRGFRSLQGLLRENAEGFFRPVLEPALDPVVDNLYGQLSAALAVSKANLLANTAGIVGSAGNGLPSVIQNLNGTAGQANRVLGRMNIVLNDVDDTLALFLRVLEKDGSGRRHVVRAIIQRLAQDQGPAIGIAVNLGDSVVNGLLADLEPTLAKIETELRDLRGTFGALRVQVAAAGGDFRAALDLANHDAAALQNYIQRAGVAVSNLLSSVVSPAGDYFTTDPARAKREIRERLVVAFLSSPVPAKYQETFRLFLYDKNFALHQLMDVLFDQVNRSIRNGLSSQIVGARDGIFQNMKGAGLMSGSLLSAKIRGAPTFEGDSLRKIHLDSEIKMNLPDEMTFTAYLDIKELNSATTPLSCIPAGGPAAEVTLGAREVPLDWLGVASGAPLRLNLEARWTLQSRAVLGVGGSLEVKGKVGFKGCSLNDFGASLAIGQTENYFAGKAGATVLILGVPVNFNAGIFAGKACSLDPLRFVDSEVEQVILVAGDFSGVYLMFGGGLSLSDILFGTSSCLLDVRAGITTALYYQGGPRFGSIGGRQKVEVDVDLICIISAHADWSVFMRLDSVGKLTAGGAARLCGKVGACPICVRACKTLRVTGYVTDSGIDYSMDF